MSKFIENDLEQAVMEWFQDLGYQTQYGPDISPGGSFSERESFGDVVLYDRLHSALKRITMLKQVKKTFKPEFINRLSATVVFHDMDRPMASLILDKKLGELGSKLSSRQVEMVLSQEAHEWLLQRGFIPEYGAREMDRVIAAHLKPLLMREILFGTLKAGGKVRVQVENGALKLQPATE